jgi:hypothetical protein
MTCLSVVFRANGIVGLRLHGNVVFRIGYSVAINS